MSVPNGNVGLIVSYLLGGVVAHGDTVLARRLITSQAGALHLDKDSRTALLPDCAASPDLAQNRPKIKLLVVSM